MTNKPDKRKQITVFGSMYANSKDIIQMHKDINRLIVIRSETTNKLFDQHFKETKKIKRITNR